MAAQQEEEGKEEKGPSFCIASSEQSYWLLVKVERFLKKILLDTFQVVPNCYKNQIPKYFTLKCCFLTWRRAWCSASENVDQQIN